MTPRRPQRMKRRCKICERPIRDEGKDGGWCPRCEAATDQIVWGSQTVVAEWAAKRARNFERLRNRKRVLE